VRCVNLSDDELWRAIAENTNAMSALINELFELGGFAGAANDRRRMIDRFQNEYQELTAELRRRYPAASAA
jgi:ATP-dependent protease HslVU (ClpYQ) peptidase subunit